PGGPRDKTHPERTNLLAAQVFGLTHGLYPCLQRPAILSNALVPLLLQRRFLLFPLLALRASGKLLGLTLALFRLGQFAPLRLPALFLRQLRQPTHGHNAFQAAPGGFGRMGGIVITALAPAVPFIETVVPKLALDRIADFYPVFPGASGVHELKDSAHIV